MQAVNDNAAKPAASDRRIIQLTTAMSLQNRRRLDLSRTLCAALFLSAAAGLFSPAFANTISQNLAFSLNPVAQTEVLHFQPFDLSLGTLESVAISFDATRRHDWAIWNFSGRTADVAYTTSLTGTTLSLGGDAFSFSDLQYGSGHTGTLAPVTLSEFLSEFAAGRNEFLAGQQPVYPSAFHPDSTLTSLTGQFSALSFSGDLDLSYDPGISNIIASNVFTSSLVDIFGSAKVTYTYTAPSVPDSSLGLLVPVLWVGLMLVGRARRTA